MAMREEPTKRYTLILPDALWRQVRSRLGPEESMAGFIREAVREAVRRRPRLPFPRPEGETQ